MTTHVRAERRTARRRSGASSGLCLLISWLCGCDGFATIGTLDALPDAGDAAAPEQDAGAAALGDAAAEPPISIDECQPDNAAGLAGARLAAARAGGPVAAGARVLYPYDGTVFPPNLAAPLLMWSGPKADAVYLRASAEGLRYQGCLLPNAERELAIPATLWREASQATRGRDLPLELELTAISGDTVTGPLRVSLTLGADAVDGVIYYSSYGSPLAGPTNLAAVMRLPLGDTAEPLLAPQGACAGCHAVSANGAAMLASVSGLGNAYARPGAAPRDPLAMGSNLGGAEFAAIDPTGTFYLAPAHPALLGPRTLGAFPQLRSTLFELASGSEILGSGIPEGAMTPAFSPDGAWLAFNDAGADGHALSLMVFSGALRQASEYRVIASDPVRFPAWPTFRPGGEELVFALGVSSSYGADGTLLSDLAGPPGPSSDLYLATFDGSQSTLLFRAMGYASSESASEDLTYLPFGAQDLHQNYHPNILPRRMGAHDWLFFDSVRNYGNRGVVRGLWCAALGVSAQTGEELSAPNAPDPSHPPFFVPGQEDGAANLRPIAARRDER